MRSTKKGDVYTHNEDLKGPYFINTGFGWNGSTHEADCICEDVAPGGVMDLPEGWVPLADGKGHHTYQPFNTFCLFNVFEENGMKYLDILKSGDSDGIEYLITILFPQGHMEKQV